MHRPAVATVVSVQDWEHAFARDAVAGARIRLIARLGAASELVRVVHLVDVVVVGAETPWLEPWVFGAVARLGGATIGVHRPGDRVGSRLVAAASLRLPDDVAPEALVAAAVSLGQSAARTAPFSPTTDPQTHRYSRASRSTGR